MDQCVYLVKFEDGKTVLLKAWFSDNPAETENCDACIGYSIHDCESRKCLDGGEMDYSEAEKRYSCIDAAVSDVIGFAFDGLAPMSVDRSDTDPDSLED